MSGEGEGDMGAHSRRRGEREIAAREPEALDAVVQAAMVAWVHVPGVGMGVTLSRSGVWSWTLLYRPKWWVARAPVRAEGTSKPDPSSMMVPVMSPSTSRTSRHTRRAFAWRWMLMSAS